MATSKGEQTRGAILDRAVTLVSQHGLEGLTIGRLAADLDLSKSGLFAHFRSKEALEARTLERAGERFVEAVLKPAFAQPRGEPRLRMLFERWLLWPKLVPQPGGCIFVQAAVELDDRPSPARDTLVRLQRDWLDTLGGAFRIAQQEGQLRADVEPEQLAFELYGIMLSCHHASRLLRSPQAVDRARGAFERLLDSARPAAPARRR